MNSACAPKEVGAAGHGADDRRGDKELTLNVKFVE